MATVSIQGALPGHQAADALQSIADARAEPFDLSVVADIAVRRRLPRPDERSRTAG